MPGWQRTVALCIVYPTVYQTALAPEPAIPPRCVPPGGMGAAASERAQLPGTSAFSDHKRVGRECRKVDFSACTTPARPEGVAQNAGNALIPRLQGLKV